MDSLFAVGPVYDKHLVSIIKLMLTKLKNNHPKPDSKVYVRNANYLLELYNGIFNKHNFNLTRKDYNYDKCFEEIKKCKGDWGYLRNLILQSISNIELAKSRDYMPFNKAYIDGITFATFFEHFDINSYQSGMDSNFVNFINPPKKCYEYTSSLTIEKLKAECLPSICECAKKIAQEHFNSSKANELSFWYDIEDLCRWIKNMKKTFPKEYSEFTLNCKNGNVLEDFNCYLMNCLNMKQGDKSIVMPNYYRLAFQGESVLGYYFLGWLRNGIEQGKFAAFKNLPESINHYYTDESFKTIKKTVKKKKEVIDEEDIIF